MSYSVLILEDQQDKANYIKGFLDEQGYNVSWADCVQSMEKQLYKMQFDIVVIDIHVPKRSLGEPKKDGGLDAIGFIRTTSEMIYRPKNIIIMSEFAGQEDMYKDFQLRGFGYPIIDFSWEDDNWKERLIEQIEISISMAGRKADILIAVAVDVELDSIWKASNWNSFTLPGDDVTYYSLNLATCNGGNASIVLCKANQMGPVGCANMVAKAISRFSPEFVFMVGIAAGKRGSTKACDIVVASKAADYSYGKIIECNGKIDFEGRAEVIDIDRFLRQGFDSYKNTRKEEVLEFIKRETRQMAMSIFKPSEYDLLEQLNSIDILVGKVVSGPCVVASDKFKQKYISRSHNDYKALDMETYSLYFAAKYAETDKPIKFVSIKAISDMGDTDKSDLYQKICVLESYNMARYYILNDMELNT